MAEPLLKMQIVKADQDLHDPSLTIPSPTMQPRALKTLLGLALLAAAVGCVLADKDRTLNHLTAIYDA